MVLRYDWTEYKEADQAHAKIGCIKLLVDFILKYEKR